MFGKISKSVFGTANDRYVKKIIPLAKAIEGLEEEYSALSDAELMQKTTLLKEELAQGKSLDSVLVPAFAAVREAAKRTLGLTAFRVQLIGAVVLHRGEIAEMRTGEGKTLVAAFAAYLNALEGKGVHIITVNDYLTKRDAEWMSPVYEALGLSTAFLNAETPPSDRQSKYQADITYLTNKDAGFDYLRDNMQYSLNDLVQRPYNFAIIDEVDSILIDEARTPLIISGPSQDHSEIYVKMDELIKTLKPEDYEIDLKSRSLQFTEEGNDNLDLKLKEAGLLTNGDLYDAENASLIHHATTAAIANFIYEKDTDYMLRNNEVLIVDPFTGRTMEGRRWGNGVHQAIEAKEGLNIQPESQTLASTTYQNFFRLYPKLSGMTGTAMTEAAELSEIYSLNVIEIPTNKDILRKDEEDLIYLTTKDKNDAVLEAIQKAIQNGQPVLVGTTSVEKIRRAFSTIK